MDNTLQKMENAKDLEKYLEEIADEKIKTVSFVRDNSTKINYPKEMILGEHIEILHIYEINSKFVINGSNMSTLVVDYSIDFSDDIVYLPKIRYLTLNFTNLKTKVNPETIKIINIDYAVLPVNFTDETISLNHLRLCTHTKLSNIPKTKTLFANFIYRPTGNLLIANKDMEENPENVKVILINKYLDKIIYKIPTSIYQVANPTKKILTDLMANNVEKIAMPRVMFVDYPKETLLSTILKNYNYYICVNTVYLIKKIRFCPEIYYGSKSDIILNADIITSVVQKITDGKKRFMISRLLMRDIKKSYLYETFEEDIDKIEIVVSHGKVNTVLKQKNCVYAKKLTIDRKIKVNNLLADRITCLIMRGNHIVNGEIMFPNLERLIIETSDINIESIKFNNNKIKFLGFKTYMCNLPKKIDLGIFPNLEQITLMTRDLIESLQNPNRVRVKIYYDYLRLITDPNTPLIVTIFNNANFKILRHFNVRTLYVESRDNDIVFQIFTNTRTRVVKINQRYFVTETKFNIRLCNKIVSTKKYYKFM